ncbi:MAG: hypothetical protein SGARI_000622, partial [Bacillariaceae sp.]
LVVGAEGCGDAVGLKDMVGDGVSTTGSMTGDFVGDGVIVGAGDAVGDLVGSTGSPGTKVADGAKEANGDLVGVSDSTTTGVDGEEDKLGEAVGSTGSPGTEVDGEGDKLGEFVGMMESSATGANVGDEVGVGDAFGSSTQPLHSSFGSGASGGHSSQPPKTFGMNPGGHGSHTVIVGTFEGEADAGDTEGAGPTVDEGPIVDEGSTVVKGVGCVVVPAGCGLFVGAGEMVGIPLKPHPQGPNTLSEYVSMRQELTGNIVIASGSEMQRLVPQISHAGNGPGGLEGTGGQLLVGAGVGMLEGDEDGKVEGCRVGFGDTVGDRVGTVDGVVVGAGDTVGAIGASLGVELGSAVGVFDFPSSVGLGLIVFSSIFVGAGDVVMLLGSTVGSPGATAGGGLSTGGGLWNGGGLIIGAGEIVGTGAVVGTGEDVGTGGVEGAVGLGISDGDRVTVVGPGEKDGALGAISNGKSVTVGIL